MPKPESVLENETPKILRDSEIQTNVELKSVAQ